MSIRCSLDEVAPSHHRSGVKLKLAGTASGGSSASIRSSHRSLASSYVSLCRWSYICQNDIVRVIRGIEKMIPYLLTSTGNWGSASMCNRDRQASRCGAEYRKE